MKFICAIWLTIWGFCLETQTSLTAKRDSLIETLREWGKGGFWARLVAQAGITSITAVFSLMFIGMLAIIFLMKMAPSLFSSAAEVQAATGTDAPDATSKSFLGMLPWIFIGLITIILIIVMLRNFTGGHRKKG